MNSENPSSVGSKYAAKREARRLRMFDTRTDAAVARARLPVHPQLYPGSEYERADQAARTAAHDARVQAAYERRRAQIAADIERHKSEVAAKRASQSLSPTSSQTLSN
jgi:hypothetical protein